MRSARAALPLLLAGLALSPRAPAWADAAALVGSTGGYVSNDGSVLYAQICQGCHMANARGGAGAAVIPALAGNAKLKAAGYPIYVVLNGYGAMPWFSPSLSDAQVAAVVNYVRGHFGNSYADVVKPEDVAAIRGPDPTMEK